MEVLRDTPQWKNEGAQIIVITNNPVQPGLTTTASTTLTNFCPAVDLRNFYHCPMGTKAAKKNPLGKYDARADIDDCLATTTNS